MRESPTNESSEVVERQLERYRSMRDFHLSAEPKGDTRGRATKKKPSQLPFVVQKHEASRLHYDFRLGWKGVLKSWAVAKGPSFYPGDKRLAVQVEDHPIEYGGFEGTIPHGQYGGGTVMVWDSGDWKPDGDVEKGLREGHLKFELDGMRLKGKWALVRMHGSNQRADKPNWLLIKEKDSFAREDGAPAITDEAVTSALTQRTLAEIAESQDHVWNSSTSDAKPGTVKAQEAKEASGAKTRSLRKPPNRNSVLLRSAPAEKLPGFIPPQLAELAAHIPTSGDWIHELKLDGYRIQMHVHSKSRSNAADKTVKLFTRNGLDWTRRIPDVGRAGLLLEIDEAILDGEVVVLDSEGRSDFALLQAVFQKEKEAYLVYFVFDLLHLNGRNTRGLTLLERKQLLEEVIGSAPDDSPIRISRNIAGAGEKMFQEACRLEAEGIVSKLAEAKYTSGRGRSWLKVKCAQEQELVIGGFTLPSHGGHGIGALLLGYYRGGEFIYAGRSGTGFTQQTHRKLRAQLDRLKRSQPAFVEIPSVARKGATWVKPTLVGQFSFANWTADELVRQASFKGLREDKRAGEVVKETAVSRGKTNELQRAKPGNTVKTSSSRRKASETIGEVAITHPDKILDEESGLTKRALAEYLLAVADVMLPHVADRPLSVVRCPEGSGKPCFFQKHIGRGMPDGVKSIAVPNTKTGEKEEYLTLNSAQGLVGLAQMGVLEIHPWGSRNESLERPDRVIFDLDPDVAIAWETLAAGAEEFRESLRKLGLKSFVKSTGGKGLHVVVPIQPEQEWPAVKQFAHEFVLEMERRNKDVYLTKMTKASRKGRIYLDYLRNDREATAIAPWSPRARRGAPIAVPLNWSELQADKMPLFHVTDLVDLRGRIQRDPWKAMGSLRQSLPGK
jgi:bifunctional non-homologous end joining protein LigD